MTERANVSSLAERLRAATQARIGLGRSGTALPTGPMLAFQAAHAQARDAIQTPLDIARLKSDLNAQGEDPAQVLHLASRAGNRMTYLTRPDLGRRLDEPSCETLRSAEMPACQLAIILADGLCARALQTHAPALVSALKRSLSEFTFCPLIIAEQARVAIGDDIGERLAASIALVLIGERPGLSSPDSLGAYLTWSPKVGRADAERNCVSNIRSPHGLAPDLAARKLAWLIREAHRRKLTGTGLKDDFVLASTDADAPMRLDAQE